eukprot:TRINITY_DN114_c5_g1_i1.p1 TRINITY_DN114_c5_g1~~TRINITY_DN114_c5_g1_i1.p1  ORF type:complete len:206 (+),score=45.94 TRINITY_DN114_c5_g1_i1:61-678(+)
MVLGDFGGSSPAGFDNGCYGKVVDHPQHFRMKPKQAPVEQPLSWGFKNVEEKKVDWDKTARYGCKARDHKDMLTSNKQGSGYDRCPRPSKKVAEKEPTSIVGEEQSIGRRPGSTPKAAQPLQVGKKPLTSAATKTVANISDPQSMPRASVQRGRGGAEFSVHSQPTMGDPSMYIPLPRGKKQNESRSRMTTGSNQLIYWEGASEP